MAWAGNLVGLIMALLRLYLRNGAITTAKQQDPILAQITLFAGPSQISAEDRATLPRHGYDQMTGAIFARALTLPTHHEAHPEGCPRHQRAVPDTRGLSPTPGGLENR